MVNSQAALALSAAALVPSVFGASLPPLATVRAAAGDAHMRHAECVAITVSACTVLAVAVLADSAEVAVVGGAMTLAYALLYRRARTT